jgi:hypothetical protein
MLAGENYSDDLISRSGGGRIYNQVAKDSCANKTVIGGGLSFEVDANVIRADGIGINAKTLQVLDVREGSHGEG